MIRSFIDNEELRNAESLLATAIDVKVITTMEPIVMKLRAEEEQRLVDRVMREATEAAERNPSEKFENTPRADADEVADYEDSEFGLTGFFRMRDMSEIILEFALFLMVEGELRRAYSIKGIHGLREQLEMVRVHDKLLAELFAQFWRVLSNDEGLFPFMYQLYSFRLAREWFETHGTTPSWAHPQCWDYPISYSYNLIARIEGTAEPVKETLKEAVFKQRAEQLTYMVYHPREGADDGIDLIEQYVPIDNEVREEENEVNEQREGGGKKEEKKEEEKQEEDKKTDQEASEAQKVEENKDASLKEDDSETLSTMFQGLSL